MRRRHCAKHPTGLRRAGHLSDILGCSIALADIRITQGRLAEALRNVAKHATVDEAWVALTATGPELMLRVHDEGVAGPVDRYAGTRFSPTLLMPLPLGDIVALHRSRR